MSRDPLGYAAGENLYRYVLNNPTTFVDPWGLKESELIPDTTDHFVERLILAWNQSQKIRTMQKDLRKIYCDYSVFTCPTFNPTQFADIEAERYWQYYKLAFWPVRDLKKGDYHPTFWIYWSKENPVRQLKVWSEVWNHDDPGNFLIWYTVAASNISLPIIWNLSILNAMWDEANYQIRKDLSFNHFVEATANEIRDDIMILRWYIFYQIYGLNIDSEKLRKYLD